jgi:glutamate 5-kinase
LSDRGSFKRIVVKIGTSLLTGGTGRLDREAMAGLVDQIARLHKEGREVVVVSSGAVAAGRERLGQVRKLRHVPLRQVYAAVGQGRLMALYDELFRHHEVTIAQTLLTRSELQERVSYLNARNTLLGLLELRVISIVNENDVVAVEELEAASFGDNDNLSALVAGLVDADVLLLPADIAGLYTADPNKDPSATRIPVVERVDRSIELRAGASASELARGGMATKIQAAKTATAAGITMIIADGREPDMLLRLAGGEEVGTVFLPTGNRMESRKRWMLSGLSQKGTVVVDDGAATALVQRKGSLLAAGVSAVEGRFGRGDIVGIRDGAGHPIGYGIANYGVEDLASIKGLRSGEIEGVLGHHYGDEVVHRNNLVLV